MLACLPELWHVCFMIIAFVNQKGGVGKTTLAVHFALWCAQRGRRVALIDTDCQQTATKWIRTADPSITLRAQFEADAVIEEADRLSGAHDLVVADGPANLADCTRALLLVADRAIVPCGPTLPDLEATTATLRILANARRVRSDRLPQPLLVLARLRSPRYRLSREALAAAQTLAVPVARRPLPLREAIADAPGQRCAVWSLGSAARAAADEMLALMKEIDCHAECQKVGARTTEC
jgi:chromosome partitioning protein